MLSYFGWSSRLVYSLKTQKALWPAESLMHGAFHLPGRNIELHALSNASITAMISLRGKLDISEDRAL